MKQQTGHVCRARKRWDGTGSFQEQRPRAPSSVMAILPRRLQIVIGWNEAQRQSDRVKLKRTYFMCDHFFFCQLWSSSRLRSIASVA